MLSSMCSVHFDSGHPESDDPIERESCRPDNAIVSYGIFSMIPPSNQSAPMVRKPKNKGAVCAAPLFVPIPGIFLFIKSSEIIIPCQEKIFRIPAKQIPDIISIIFFIKICSSLREIGDPAAAVPVGIRCDKAYKFLF